MAFIKLKPEVKVPRTVIILAAVINSVNQLSLPDMLVTSGNDSQHMTGSKHYSDEALDFRTKHLTTDQKHKLLAEVKKRLGKGYDAILESENKTNEHLHVEWDPA